MAVQADDGLPGVDAGPGSEPGEADPGMRGRLTVRSRAAARIVELAALEVPGVVRRTTRLGSLTGRELPRAIVDLSAGQPNVRLDIALAWPGQIAALCYQVRQHVAGELFRHLQRRPSRVDIAVTELVPEMAESSGENEGQ